MCCLNICLEALELGLRVLYCTNRCRLNKDKKEREKKMKSHSIGWMAWVHREEIPLLMYEWFPRLFHEFLTTKLFSVFHNKNNRGKKITENFKRDTFFIQYLCYRNIVLSWLKFFGFRGQLWISGKEWPDLFLGGWWLKSWAWQECGVLNLDRTLQVG